MKEARFYTKLEENRIRCDLCPHGCIIEEGRRGRCQVRENQGGQLMAMSYGRISSLAMDPIEKKPLYHFLPGRQILSVGSYGCNFSCTFCQNYSISQYEVDTQSMQPEQLVEMARKEGSCGVAYTYNEPYISFEFVLDCAQAAREAGLKNVMVSNGFYRPAPLEELLPWIDAWNIDIKSGEESFYSSLCGGALQPVLDTVERIAKDSHVELTTLLIPSANDNEADLRWLSEWIRDHVGKDTATHLSAYAPRYKMKIPATPVEIMQRARAVFKESLNAVYIGNLLLPDACDTVCPSCGKTAIARQGYHIDLNGLSPDGSCGHCGAALGIHRE